MQQSTYLYAFIEEAAQLDQQPACRGEISRADLQLDENGILLPDREQPACGGDDAAADAGGSERGGGD